MKIVEVAKTFINSDSLYFGVFEEATLKNIDWEFESNNAEQFVLLVGNDDGFMITPVRYMDSESYIELISLLKKKYNEKTKLKLDRAVPMLHINMDYSHKFNYAYGIRERVNNVLIKDQHPYHKYKLNRNLALIPIEYKDIITDNIDLLRPKVRVNEPTLVIDSKYRDLLEIDGTIWGISDKEYININAAYYDIYLKVQFKSNKIIYMDDSSFSLIGGNDNE